MLPAIRVANATFAFLLELAALVAYGYAAYSLVPGGVLRVVITIAIPVAFASLWGLLVAPRAPVRVGRPLRFVLAVVLLAGAGVALAFAGRPTLGAALAILAGVNRVLIEILEG